MTETESAKEPEQSRKVELETEEIRWRMEQVVKMGLQYRDDLDDLAREFNRALEVVKNGDTQGPET